MERDDKPASMQESQPSRRFQQPLRVFGMLFLTIGISTPNRLIVTERYDECVADRPGFVWTVEKRANGTFRAYDFRKANPEECPEQPNPPAAQP